MNPNDPETPDFILGEPDQAAVDLLIEHGFDLAEAQRARPDLATRLAAAHALFNALDRYPVEPPDASLVDATLARVDRAEDERAARMTLPPPAPAVGRGRWTDFVAIACVAVLALSIGLPLLHQFRERNAIAACAANLGQLHSALHTYYNDFNSRPFAAGLGADLSRLASWNSYDNSKHLDVLHQSQYCAPHCIHCGNDTEGAGYASQVPSRHSDPLWAAHANLPLVADRNPLVFQTAFGGRVRVPTIENSPDHSRSGQNLLYGDGAVRFEDSPVIMLRRGAPDSVSVFVENIWVPANEKGDEGELHAPGSWGTIDIFLMQ